MCKEKPQATHLLRVALLDAIYDVPTERADAVRIAQAEFVVSKHVGCRVGAAR
jgi:hypothetical protein